MNNDPGIAIYVMVFLSVFASYVFAQLIVSAEKNRKDVTVNENAPMLYRRGNWFFAIFRDSLGRLAVRLQESRTAKLRKQLQIANIQMPVEYIYIAEVICGTVLLLVPAFLILGFSSKKGAVLFALMTGLIGFVYPSMSISSLAAKRQETITKSLPFAIDLIGAAMRSGLDFGAAVRYYVSTEVKTNPLAVEFGIMLRQLELGKTRIEALEAMAERIQINEFSSFCAAVAHGTEVGASIVDTLKIQAEEMRRARFNLAERKAARAPSLMIIPIALFIMPAIFIVIGTPVFLKLQSSGMGSLMK